MSIIPNLSTTGFYARPTQWDTGTPSMPFCAGCDCLYEYTNTPSSAEEVAKGRWYANGILEEWGIHYSPSAEGGCGNENWSSCVRLIPYNLVRNPDSNYYIACQDLEGILAIAGNEYSNAQDRLDMSSSRPEACNARVDKYKWKRIFDWAEIAVQMQSSNNDVDSCIVESFEEANIELNQAQIDALNDEEGFGLTNNTTLAILGGITFVSIGLILKYVK